MYIQTKKLSCMTAETGTFIFAILNVIVTSVASIFSLVTLIAAVVLLVLGIKGHEQKLVTDSVLYGAYMWAASLFLMLASFTAFVFAVFLIHGVAKKKAAHIKAYFVYGVVVNVVSFLPILAYTIIAIEMTGPVNINVMIGLGGFIAIFIYSLILVMIHKTYKNLETIDSQYDHQPLEPQKC